MTDGPDTRLKHRILYREIRGYGNPALRVPFFNALPEPVLPSLTR